MLFLQLPGCDRSKQPRETCSNPHVNLRLKRGCELTEQSRKISSNQPHKSEAEARSSERSKQPCKTRGKLPCESVAAGRSEYI